MPEKKLRICLVEPFYSGSHARWADEYKAHSKHRIELLTLPGRHWKWRMHGAAVTLAKEFLSRNVEYDLILATDMLDLSVFLSLIRERYANTTVAIYFHENQLCYPWSPRDRDTKTRNDLHYAFINYTSTLTADHVYFNSDYHRESFLGELTPYLSRYPDFKNRDTVDQIKAKSCTLPLGLNLQTLDSFQPKEQTNSKRPILLWNHRWEYDKSPKGFCKLLIKLLERGIDFEVALLGERFEEEPPYFSKLKQKLGTRLRAYGQVSSIEEYAKWLWEADILPVTSAQDFFGGSVVEAVYCGCHPILPQRLAYPDHFDIVENQSLYYEDIEEAADKLANLITSGEWKQPCNLRSNVEKYDWAYMAPRYDEEFLRIAP